LCESVKRQKQLATQSGIKFKEDGCVVDIRRPSDLRTLKNVHEIVIAKTRDSSKTSMGRGSQNFEEQHAQYCKESKVQQYFTEATQQPLQTRMYVNAFLKPLK
jgi:hypothetical protein